MTEFGYLDADCPDTVHPSLWRQAQMCAGHGLFEVTGGIYHGNPAVLGRLLSLLDTPDPAFPIVTP
ncbi:hypothetical protein EKO23_19195 [Nocardioides guangzhouensis]|uniref:Alkyl sulfatase C-terminal domain-containing protein n=1 Tax=Nocardioides guangzhouensis TaxID=2497878 RepID=A0A4Q4Z8Q6_9ACTN|nr:alkyl sulfatase C-terminal domain-containing protein [Nocardioides guangzhouensis]RYP83424.1 hypothetical protein EKO23_19195 [Nocardioides guangzhouensis]